MRVLILGAGGQIARYAIDLLLERTTAELTLYLRHPERLKAIEGKRVRLFKGDVLDLSALESVMPGHDAVYANLDGELERQAKNVIAAMKRAQLRRLIWVSSMGIYDEVPGQHAGSVLDPYRKSAAIIEASDLDYTIIRPEWLSDEDEIDYETTQKGEPFLNASAYVSRKSIADLIVKLIEDPKREIRRSLGVNKTEARRS
jgi:uncharacterized protein YbjT (DUF2867 family)